MRIITLILLGLMTAFNLAAQANRRIIQLSGSVSDYPIKMTLAFHGDKILGFYSHENKAKILLEGQINGEKITLSEKPGYESEFRIGFIGDFKGGTFAGIWTDKEKNELLNFRTAVNSDNSIKITNKIADVEGIYENVHSSDSFISSVQLKYIADDFFCFEISEARESGCVGYSKGLLKLTDLKASYSDDGCEEIGFSLLAKELTLTEKNCEWHGMNCPFQGQYKKK
jgi:hypothetical protein